MGRRKYRKRNGIDTWHFCSNCHLWPTSDYREENRQIGGELCNHCQDKEDNNNCTYA